jgi:formylglycine-generating enzyme required for sulfatase activity
MVANTVSAQKSATANHPGKDWALVSGKQYAVNENNRVYYCVNTNKPCGQRVNQFEKMDSLDVHDSDFLRFHLNADQVFDMSKTIAGPDFYIAKTEVSNAQYRAFIKDCIRQWMKENKPEVVKQYKEDAPEYIKTVYEWLRYEPENRFYGDTLRGYTWAELEMQMRNLDYRRITWKGIAVYPNTNSWTEDFPYSYNEPLTRSYFHHPKYDNYPVVGISHEQATLFCEWYSKRNGNGLVYRLPTEQEWERAASVLPEKPSKKSSGSPVKNNYLRNAKGCYIANYYPVFRNFGIDGGLYPVQVQSYLPNDAGCFNMQGNVAEWTSTSMKFKNGENLAEGYLIKGGAWNLPEAACTVGSRSILHKNDQRSYVGFRSAQDTKSQFQTKAIAPRFWQTYCPQSLLNCYKILFQR